MDLYNGEIISYTISEHPNLLMITNMVDKAFKGLNKKCGLILHTDQGWHYQHAIYQKTLKDSYSEYVTKRKLSG